MKKRIIIIVAVILAILLAVAFIILSPYLISKPIEQVLNVDFSKVDKIKIGARGRDCTLTDKSNIENILKRLDRAKLRKSFDQDIYDSETLYIELYESGKSVCSFVYVDNNLTVTSFSHFVRYEASVELSDADIDEISTEYKLKGKSR